jgi:ribose 5-phosphate isomerase B
MKLVIASDEKTHLTDGVVEYLRVKGHELVLLGDLVEKSGKWVEIGRRAGEMVARREVEQGILFCWSGTGVAMAANRVKGVQAALCWDVETARLARKWDNANILCMSLRFTSETLAKEIMEAWFATPFDEEGLNEVHKLDQ